MPPSNSETTYPQQKAALELYTETNYSFIMEKLYTQFRNQCVKDYELKDLDLQKMISSVEKIFEFARKNQMMRSFFERLLQNLEKFTDEKYKLIDETEDMLISTDVLFEAIKFCITNGFDPIQSQPPNQQEEIQQQIQEEKSPTKTNKKIQEEQKRKKYFVVKPKTPETKNFIEKYEMPNRKKPARYLEFIAKKKPEIKSQDNIKVEPIETSILQKNRQRIEKRLEHLYQHYCSQQQNLGANTTFDKIKHECNQMTLGKFLLFCKITQIFKHKSMNKEIMQSKYKQVAEGRQEIDFSQFKNLLRQLDQKYIEFHKQQGAEIATFEARLYLNNQKFKKMKKDIDLPFATRQKEGRQLKRYHYNTLEVDSNVNARRSVEPTSHSGKFSKNLKQQLKTKQQMLAENRRYKSLKKQELENPKNRIVRLDNLGKYHWPDMDWAIMGDTDNDMIDSILFTKDNKGKSVAGSAKKRVAEVQKLEKQRYSKYS